MKVNLNAILVLTAGVLLSVGTALADRPYYVTDLGTLGGAWSRPHAINASGQVVGEAYDASGNRTAFVFTPGVGMSSVGNLGAADSVAYGINDQGDIVGGSYRTDGNWHGFIKTGGVMNDLAPLSGGIYSNAFAINNVGQIAGVSDSTTRQFTTTRWNASNVASDLGTLGGVIGFGYAINTSGNVAGMAALANNNQLGSLYISSMASMGALSGGSYSEAHGINDANAIVGLADVTTTTYTHAVLKNSGGALTDLGVLSGGSYSEARDINNNSVIVGRSEIANLSYHGFVMNSGGTMLDLNNLRAPGNTAFTIYDAVAVNDNGQIAANGGADGGAERALIMTPALFGDANCDRSVKFADYLVLEQNFGKTGMTWAQGDFTGDGAVKFADYLLLEQNFGKSSNVPEPTMMVLLVSGAAAMLRRRHA